MQNSRPLIRWTIGDSRADGFEALLTSIRLWPKDLAPGARYCVCYNRLTKTEINELKTLSVTLVDQNLYATSLSLPASGTAWKLYPPRLAPKEHEIFVDNDLLLLKSPEIIQRFLNSGDKYFACQALERSYGRFENCAPDIALNSGLFGLAPNFDFAIELEKRIRSLQIKRWENHFDEQALVALILSDLNLELLPLSQISICHDAYSLGTHGIHFVGLNSGNSRYWTRFKSGRIL